MRRYVCASAFNGGDAPGARLPSGVGHIYFGGLGLWKTLIIVYLVSLFNKWEGVRTRLQDLSTSAFKHRSLLMCWSSVARARLRRWGGSTAPRGTGCLVERKY